MVTALPAVERGDWARRGAALFEDDRRRVDERRPVDGIIESG